MRNQSGSTTRGLMQRVVPSMFHRRLLLLVVGCVAVAVVLVVQLARLTVAQGAVWRQRAESVLVQRQLIPTARGQILDRRMRVLAVDKPGYDVCVRYPVITGEWAYRQARLAAYRANRELWQQLSDDDRESLIVQYQDPFDTQVDGLWRVLCEVGGVDRAQLEQRREVIIRRVKQTASVVWDRRLRKRLAQEDEPVTLADVSQPIGEQVIAHPVITNLDHASLVFVQKHLSRSGDEPGPEVWEQVSIETSRDRRYPLETMTVMLDREGLPSPLRRDTPVEVTVEGVGLHIIGALRDAWKEDVEGRPYRRFDETGRWAIDRGGYLPGDRTGRWGIEKSQEDRLRGVRGQVARRLDVELEDRHEPQPGGDVVLTLDIQLQARVQAVMSPEFGLMRVQPWHSDAPRTDPLQPQMGERLNGAAVVLDVASSQVLAAVSVPGFSLRQLRDEPGSVWGDKVNQPFMNRPVARAYQPGSVVKPLVLAAAVTDRKIGYDQKVDCKGHLDPEHNDRYRCWIYKHYNSTHGPLGGSEAIARSCNIFFYTMGKRLRGERLVGWYDRLGLGKVTGCGLYEEVRGDLPDLERAGQPGGQGLSVADAIFMAIGQGPVRWTPMQAANAYAALARGGYMINPTVIMVGQQASQQEGRQEGVDLRFDPRGVGMAMLGLKDAVKRPYGTAHVLAKLDHEPIFNLPGVNIFGKSGTAQAVPLWVDEDGDNRFTRGVDRLARRGDHAWVICLVGRSGMIRAEYVVAVVVEYGGSGGAVAGPIANQIMYAMRAEGYL